MARRHLAEPSISNPSLLYRAHRFSCATVSEQRRSPVANTPHEVTTLIDVLIPAYNAEKTVEASVRSILEQTIADLRVIVVNDGSNDGTGTILAHMAENDSRLEIITTENQGIVAALNTGLRHCRAELVARHDADDIAFPERFARQFAYLDAHPDCIAVGSNAWHIDEAGRRVGITRFSGDAKGNPWGIPAQEPYLMHSFLMARRSVMDDVGGYRHVFHSEDSDLYWRLEPFGRLHVLSDVLGEYRVHSGSITSGSARNARIGAIFSQLAAISARRRAAGEVDLAFARETLRAFEHAQHLGAMIALVAPGLAEEERSYLEVATAAKMVELRVYRKFRFSKLDILYIMGTLLRRRTHLSTADWLRISKQPLHYLKVRTWPSRFRAMWREHVC
jgi:glycosyltransferase involved in cell wall biosynthesis